MKTFDETKLLWSVLCDTIDENELAKQNKKEDWPAGDEDNSWGAIKMDM